MLCFRLGCCDTPATLLAPSAEIASLAAWSLQGSYSADPCDPGVAAHGLCHFGWPPSFVDAIGWRRDPAHTHRWNREARRLAVREFSELSALAIADALDSIVLGTLTRAHRAGADRIRARLTAAEWAEYAAGQEHALGLQYDTTLGRRARATAARFRKIHKLSSGGPADA